MNNHQQITVTKYSITVFGEVYPHGTIFSWNKGGSIITVTQQIGGNQCMSYPIIPESFHFKRKTITNEICRQNTGHKTYEEYEKSLNYTA